MFTGIVEAVGRVVEVEPEGAIRHITVEAPAVFLKDVKPGASIAVDGACLTPTRVDGDRFRVDAIGTTLSRTVAGTYGPDHRVNLERALALGGRLDGHLVQGHVDGIGQLMSVDDDGEYWRLRFRIPEGTHRMTLLHGSIALNGVSLTVNRLGTEGTWVEVGIVPHTWEHTNLSLLDPGDPVNVEGDLIGKYVGTLLARRPSAGGA